MIFNIPGHIEMIRNGLCFLPADNLNSPAKIIKTQTRRLNRGIYKVGKSYAVQRKQGVKAEPGIRILFDAIWEETVSISKADAWAEGGYTQEQYEKVFRKLNPKWDGNRWAFKFHVVEVFTTDEKEIYRKLDDAQKELDEER